MAALESDAQPSLQDEVLLLTLSTAEDRDLHGIDGIRPALYLAGVLDGWLEGAPLPPEKQLRQDVRAHSFEALDPVLHRLSASAQVMMTHGEGVRRQMPSVLIGLGGAPGVRLTDLAGTSAIRHRLQAALSSPPALDRRDGALAVLLYAGRLWNWSALEPHAVEEMRVFGRRREHLAPLKARAAQLACGDVVPAGASDHDLPLVDRVLTREYDFYSDR